MIIFGRCQHSLTIKNSVRKFSHAYKFKPKLKYKKITSITIEFVTHVSMQL